ncbi:hypothetical protein D3C80_1605340 [compost metagenome]
MPASNNGLSTPRSTRLNDCPASVGNKGAAHLSVKGGRARPTPCTIAASINSNGTEVATSKISHSWVRLSRL